MLEKEELVKKRDELLREAKKEIPDYTAGYVNGVLDLYNFIVKKLFTEVKTKL